MPPRIGRRLVMFFLCVVDACLVKLLLLWLEDILWRFMGQTPGVVGPYWSREAAGPVGVVMIK